MDYRDPVTPAERAAKIRESLIQFQENLEDIDKLDYESEKKSKSESTGRSGSRAEASGTKKETYSQKRSWRDKFLDFVDNPEVVNRWSPYVWYRHGKLIAYEFLLFAGVIIEGFSIGAMSKGTGGIGSGIIGGIIIAFAGYKVYSKLKIMRISKRVRRYIQELKFRDEIPVAELAMAVGESEKTVVKDLQLMIRENVFKEGYLINDNRLFLFTKEAYKRHALAQKAEAEKERKIWGSGRATVYKEERYRYLKALIYYADNLEDPIREDVERLTLLTAKIFERVKDETDRTSATDRFVDYYLPTTIKLLEQYDDLLTMPDVKNRDLLMKAIEESISMEVTAFENLFNDLMLNEMTDVKSDVAVLKMMLDREGLLGKDFGNDN